MSRKCSVGLGLLVVILALVHISNGGVTEAGYEKNDAAVYVANDPIPQGVSQPAAVMSSSGELIEGRSFTWVGSGNGNVPAGAVLGGRTACGETLYIGRVYHGSDLLPGKVHPSTKNLYVSNGGKEYYYTNYEVLVETKRGLPTDDQQSI